MFEALSVPGNRKRTFTLLGVCGVVAAGAAAVGISDNPPGLLLAYLSTSTLVVALVHPWRASKQFQHLAYGSVLGFITFGVLHNVFDAVASNVASSGFLHSLVAGAGTLFFLVATMLCPAGLVVGVIGALVMSRRNRGSQPGPARTA